MNLKKPTEMIQELLDIEIIRDKGGHLINQLKYAKKQGFVWGESEEALDCLITEIKTHFQALSRREQQLHKQYKQDREAFKNRYKTKELLGLNNI